MEAQKPLHTWMQPWLRHTWRLRLGNRQGLRGCERDDAMSRLRSSDLGFSPWSFQMSSTKQNFLCKIQTLRCNSLGLNLQTDNCQGEGKKGKEEAAECRCCDATSPASVDQGKASEPRVLRDWLWRSACSRAPVGGKTEQARPAPLGHSPHKNGYLN